MASFLLWAVGCPRFCGENGAEVLWSLMEAVGESLEELREVCGNESSIGKGV